MNFLIKTEEQIEKMRHAGKILAALDEVLKQKIQVGVTTSFLDAIAEDFIKSKNAIPSFKGYNGFPASICTSVNDEIIHGIPGLKKLKDGDIISIDMGCFYKGFHADCARTYGVGTISNEDRKLIDVTKNSFFEGIKYAKPGYYVNDIGRAIQKYAEGNGFSVVRDYCGHGIGRNLHEDPSIYNFKTLLRGQRLTKGMTLAIEPMVCFGSYETKVLLNDWTVVTQDGMNSAHYENTILVTDDVPEILTI